MKNEARTTRHPNERGISLLLVLLILGLMLTTTLIIGDIILRQGKVMKKITASQRAYFAAETGIEETLYEINKTKIKNINTELSGCWCGAGCDNCQINYSGANAQWNLINIMENRKAPAVDDIWTDNPGDDISTSNRLNIRLQDGESFQLSFDMNGSSYAGSIIRISWDNSKSSQVIAVEGDLGSSIDNQSEYDESDVTIKIPETGNLQADRFYKLRISNTSGEQVVYEMWPSGGSFMPMGATIEVSADYKGTERKVESNNHKWQIYGQ